MSSYPLANILSTRSSFTFHSDLQCSFSFYCYKLIATMLPDKTDAESKYIWPWRLILIDTDIFISDHKDQIRSYHHGMDYLAACIWLLMRWTDEGIAKPVTISLCLMWRGGNDGQFGRPSFMFARRCQSCRSFWLCVFVCLCLAGSLVLGAWWAQPAVCKLSVWLASPEAACSSLSFYSGTIKRRERSS